MKKLRGAVVGLGYWGPNLVRNLLKIPEVELKIVCDLSHNALTKFAKDYPSIQTTTNYQNILKDTQIDFVVVATPIKTHFSLAKAALLANKHVLVEKPMTYTTQEANALIALAAKQKKICMVGHTFIFTDAIQKIKKIITTESFGKLLYFDSTRINLGRFQSDVNVLWDLAPHDLSILTYLLDDMPKSVFAVGSSHISKANIEIAHVFLTYKHNVTAHIHVSWLSPVKMRNMLIGGSKQMIQYNDIEPSEKIRIYNKSVRLDQNTVTPFQPAYRSGTIVIPHLSQTEALHTQLVHFVDCIMKNKTPLSSDKTGVKVVQLLEAIDKAIKAGKPISL